MLAFSYITLHSFVTQYGKGGTSRLSYHCACSYELYLHVTDGAELCSLYLLKG